MSLSKSIPSYTDVHQVLVAAIKHGGGTYKLPPDTSAVYWRMRANMYRKLIREAHNIQTFDNLVFTLDGNSVIITLNRPQGEFISPEGESIVPETTSPEDILPKTGLTNFEGKPIPTDEAEAQALDLVDRIKAGKLFDE